MRRRQWKKMIAPGGARGAAQRWLPSLVFAASLTIAAGFWLVVAHQNKREFAAHNRQTVVSTQNEISTRLQARLHNLASFSARWERWGEPEAGRWEFDARLYEKSYPECRSITLIGPDARVRRSVEAAPGSDPACAPGSISFSELSSYERAALAAATRTGTPIVLPRREHGPYTTSLQVALPLTHQGRHEGFFIAGFDTELELQSISRHLAPGYDLAVYAGGDPIFRRAGHAPTQSQAHWMQEASAPYGGQTLTTRLWPSVGMADAVAASYAPIALLAGFGASFLLAWLAALTATARRRAEESTDANRALETQIAERMVAEEELQRISAETEIIFASIPSLLIGVDRDGLITTWNDAARAAFGVASADALGEPLEHCLACRWEQIAAEVSACRESGEKRSLDHAHFTRADGSEGVLRLTIAPIRTPGGGGDDGLLILGADITEQQILETQLAQSQKLESIGQLAAGIAHEINTPIQYVGDNTRFLGDAFRDLKGMVECYEQLLDIAAEAGAPAARLEAAKQALADADAPYLMAEIPSAIAQSLEGVERVAHLVRAMKDFSHPSSGEKTLVDINRAIDSTVTVARNEWKYVAELTMDLDPDLPMVACLSGEVNQVILNMVVNAAHAIGDVVGDGGADKGKIGIRTRRDGDWVEIRISDTGSGMSEEVKNRIFDPFFTTKEVGRGTGQGLSISRAVIIERHGGEIAVETAPGAGTTFAIRLPIHTERNQLEAA